MKSTVQASVRRILRPWVLSTLAAAAVAGQAVADPASTKTDTLEEIVVTAQFRQQNLQDTPLAITAVNAEMMEQRGQISLHDLGQQAPNVQLVETGGAFGPGMTASIRGIGQADFDPAFAPGVGVYIDDVYYTSLTGSNFALLDLDRVEILRGPQGTLSGANSEGGSIKIYSVKPQGNDTGSVKVSYGQRNLIDVQGMADVPLIGDSLFMRISGITHQQDGYVTRIDYGCAFPTSGIPAVGGLQQDCVSGKEGGKDYTGGRIALRWLASDNFEANLTGDVTIDKSQTAAVTLLAVNPASGGAFATNINSGFPPGNAAGVAYDSRFVPTNPYISYASFCAAGLAGNTYCFSPDTYNKQWGTNLTLDWKLAADLAFKSITGYREFDTQWTEDNDVSPLYGSLGAEHLLNHTFTQELRLNGKVGSVLDYTVGGFYLDQVTTYPTHQVLDYVIPHLNFEFLGNDPIQETDYAGFANADWHIAEALDLNAGLRYTHQEKDYTYNRYNPPTIGGGGSIFFPPGFSGTQGKYSGDKTDYRVDLDYRWSPELMTYVSVSTGFKGGGTNPRPFVATQIVPFGPESLTNYEIGAKSDWFNHSLRLNVAGFYSKYKDIQVVLLSCPQFSGGNALEPCAAPVNGGDANIYGVEMESEFRYGGLSIQASGSWQKFEYTYVVPASGIPPDSTEPGFQPKKWSLGAQYEAHVPNGGSVTPRLDWSYASGYQTVAVPDPYSYLPGYHVLNGRITFRPASNKWEASVVGSNLTGKLWYTQIFDLSGQSGADYGIPAAPRAVWAEFKMKFGPPPPAPPPIVKEVVKEVVREVVREVQVPAPAPVLPPAPRGDIVLRGVNFATNSADLIPESTGALDRQAAELKSYPNLVIEVRGYTDSRGSAAYNLNLSQRRAESVMHYLQQHGVTNRMTAKGFGKEDPLADNTTKDGQLTNRRVTLHIEGGAP
ncbi:MAG TPA: OmpA family protein [Steroidobacteraceae bacterium]|nr:OmpA family protein [Steroidobacteraceae bacterium]